MNIRRTFEGDINAAERISHEADACMRKTQEIKNRLGLSYINKSYTLAGGEMVHVVVTQDASYVHTIAPLSRSYEDFLHKSETMATVTFGVPDYVSGAVLSPIIDALDKQVDTGRDKNAEISDPDADMHVMATITRDTLRNVRLVERHYDRHDPTLAKEKLAVLPAPGHEPIVGPFDTNKYSQYKTMSVGLFTGFMRTVVQLMAGIGKVVIVDDTDNGVYAEADTYEKRWLKENTSKTLDVQSYPLDNATEPPYRDDYPYKLYTRPKETVEVAVAFHAKSFRTHGISWDTMGRAYLIEIGQRGCFAMPFPLDPYSLTEKGRARYLELMPELDEQDDSGRSIFGSLGGFPAIDCVPASTSELERYVRAGEAVKFIDAEGMSPFYNNMPYSSAVCWAFNPVSNRADNTCYGYPEGSKTAVGYHFAVTWAIAAQAEPEESPLANALISSLKLKGFEARKAKRMDQSQLEELFEISNMEDRYQAFDEAVVKGSFRVTGNLKLVKKGNLYHPGKLVPKECFQFSAQPQIKFPEPLIGGLVSFDFGPIDHVSTRPRCDTPMYVLYNSDGTLYTVNYFYDPKPPTPAQPTDTRESCQYTGSWEYRSPESQPYVAGNFYSSQWDTRKEVEGGSSYTKTTGEILGYTVFVPMSCSAWWAHSIAYTEVWGSQTSHSEHVGGHSLRDAVAIPIGDRSIFYMCSFEQQIGRTQTDSYSGTLGYGAGSTIVLNVAVYNWYVHWFSCSVENTWGLPADYRLHEYADPTPIETCFPDAPVPTCPTYEVPGKNGGIATGYHDLKPGTVFKLSFREGTVPVSSPWSVTTKPSAMVEYKVRIFGDTEIDGLYTYKDKLEGEDEFPEYEGQLVNFYSTPLNPGWFKPSPDACGSYVYLFVNRNHWGSNLIVYDDQVNALNTKFKGSPPEMDLYVNAKYVGHVV